ncbi:MAG: tripartite tricarboxylate transporter substrate binding protein [Hyphomicrobiaceae bacterium]|nr:MAG: tripartite tricarboxylate transporter substrate binding protein [Hyphomicrobiaceae bacterium]
MIRSLFTTLVALAVCAGIMPAHAQTYPTKPVTLVVPFPSGGVTDILGRLVAERLSGALGQKVVVENRAGAGGNVGMIAAANVPADGYTLFLGTMGTNAINASLYRDLPIKPAEAFAPLAMVATLPNVLVVNPRTHDIRTAAELIAAAKKASRPLTYGSFGNGSSAHISGALLAVGGGVSLNHVPFRGSGPAMTSLIGGEIDLMFDSMPTALPQVKGGAVRALAVTSANRSSIMPDVPTMQEAGFKGYDLSVWFGVFARSGTPKPILDRLATEIQKIVAQPDVQARMRSLGADPFIVPTADMPAFIAREAQRWAKVVADNRISLD